MKLKYISPESLQRKKKTDEKSLCALYIFSSPHPRLFIKHSNVKKIDCFVLVVMKVLYDVNGMRF